MRMAMSRSRKELLATGAILLVGLVLVFWFKGALFPFILAGILALILQPIARKLQGVMPWRRRWPNITRVAAIMVIYLAAAGVVAGMLALIIPPAYSQAVRLIAEVPELYEGISETLQEWNRRYWERIPEDIRQRIQAALEDAGSVIAGEVQTAASFTMTAISGTLTVVIGLVLLPILLFYLLKDQEPLSEGMYATFPGSVRPHIRSVFAIVSRVIGAYVRGQLFLGLVVGVIAFLGLFSLGIQFSVLLGIFAGVTELIPVLGPWLGAIAGILVTLATAPEKVIWVALLYLGIQVLENVLLVPRIQGEVLGLHPIVVILVILVGTQIAGIWGLIIGPPLVATGREVIRYFIAEWNRPLLLTDVDATAEAAAPAGSPVGQPGAEPAPADNPGEPEE